MTFPSISPKYSMSDFEKAMRKGIKNVYPEIKINGCHFHFCQVCNTNDFYHKIYVIYDVIKIKIFLNYFRRYTKTRV